MQVALKKIYAIADQVGFSRNPQYFVQLFKSATGMTPKAWVKENGGKAD